MPDGNPSHLDLRQRLSNPACYDAVMKINVNNEQLELSIHGKQSTASAPAYRSRRARADWWFTQMRNIVSRAVDWETASVPRPEQIWMPGAHREVEV